MTDFAELKTKPGPGFSPDATSLRAARAFIELLGTKYPVREVLMYGSRVRGGDSSESDLDLAIVLSHFSADRAQTARELAGVAFDAMLKTGVLVDPLPVLEDELDGTGGFPNPHLIAAIKRDGIRV